jgi:hypothetical protein
MSVLLKENTQTQRIKAFIELDRLKKQYMSEPLDETKETLSKHSFRMIRKGMLSKNNDVYFDAKLEKFRRVDLTTGVNKVLDREFTLKQYMLETYIALDMPKSLAGLFPTRYSCYEPHKEAQFKEGDDIYRNTFTKTEYQKIERTIDNSIESINWKMFPLWKTVFSNVFPSDEELHYSVNLFAHMFQSRRKSGVAIISKGIQGTGKGTIYKYIIKRIIGANDCVEIGQQDLESTFSSKITDKLFILANEVQAEKRSGNSSYNRLKSWLTEDTVSINQKNVKEYEDTNHFNMWFHSNKEIPIQIEHDDRRYTVIKTTTEPLSALAEKMGFHSTKELFAVMEQETHALCVQLMLLKVDEKLASKALESESKQEVIEMSTSKVETMVKILINKDRERIEDIFENEFQRIESAREEHMVVSVMGANITMCSVDDVVNEVMVQLDNGFIQSTMLQKIMSIYFSENMDLQKVGWLTSRHFKGSKRIQVSGKRVKKFFI